MKRIKRTMAVLLVLLVMASGAITVFAVSSEADKAPSPAPAVTADYAAEEMAVESYYQELEMM